MIVGLGVDIVSIERIARMYRRHGERCFRHLLTPAETAAMPAGPRAVQRLAGRFAAKEAVMKALGTGVSAGVTFTQIEILNDPAGAPRLTLHGAAAERSRALGGSRWHVSISHSDEFAVAEAILEGDGDA
ncbi:MAG: holo-ACP synthase [Armatimonadetes bacterium]|nr:holo-ACP synthase [Armatimonadota bacterium]